MKFLLYGRVDGRLLREEIKAPTLDAAIEDARGLLAEKGESRGRDVSAMLFLTPPVWEFCGQYDGEAVVTVSERTGSLLDH